MSDALILVRPAWGHLVHFKQHGVSAALCGKTPASRARGTGWYYSVWRSDIEERYRPRVCAKCVELNGGISPKTHRVILDGVKFTIPASPAKSQ